MSIEEKMDEAKIPYPAQRASIPDFPYCDGLRDYVVNVRDKEPGGINFAFVLDPEGKAGVCTLTAHEARTLYWVFAKELILSGRTVLVMTAQVLAERLLKATPWEADFEPDYADHLLLTSTFRSGQEQPYTPKEKAKLLDYLGERYDYGKTTHTFWEFRSDRDFKDEAETWYPASWLDFWFEEQTTKWIGRK